MSFRLGAGGTHLGEVVPPAAPAWAQLASWPMHASLSTRAKAVKLSSHVMMTPYRLSSSISQVRSWSYSSAITAEEGTDEGTEALHQSTSKG
jgi:hypothetical protein